MFSETLQTQAKALLAQCLQKGIKITTAESCTGGLIAALLTEIPGSSAVVERGFVTYSNESKIESLGVEKILIAEHGAVSQSVAAAMAQGAIRHSKADLAVAVTGIAGPGGGTIEKPIGLVFIAIASHDNVTSHQFHFNGNRTAIRLASVAQALELLSASLNQSFVYVA